MGILGRRAQRQNLGQPEEASALKRGEPVNLGESERGSGFRQGRRLRGERSFTSNDMTMVSNAGELVDEALASKLPAWAGRTNLIVRQCLKIPLYARDDISLERIDPQPRWLMARPALDMSSRAWKFRMYYGLVTRGWCAFEVKSLGSNGLPDRVLPLPPRFCTLWPDGDRVQVQFNPYGVGSAAGSQRFNEWRGMGDAFKPGASAWIMRLSDDGSLGGINPIEEAIEAIGLGLAAQVSAGGEFASGGLGRGILSFPGLAEDSVEKLSDEYGDKRSDPEDRHSIDVVNVDGKWIRMDGTLGEMQNLKARKMQVSEVARFDSIPPGLLGQDMTTWGSGVAAMRNILNTAVTGFFLDCAAEELTMLVSEGIEVYADRRKMLRGSEREEWDMLGKGIKARLITPNEGRREVGYPEVEGGDKLIAGKGEKGDRGDGTDARIPREDPGDNDPPDDDDPPDEDED